MKVPVRGDFKNLNDYLLALEQYENFQIERLKNWELPPVEYEEPRTIYRGYRIIFRVQNAVGQVAYFDKQKEAVKCGRLAQQQPCTYVQIPILPMGTHCDTPIEELAGLVEDELKGKNK